MKQDKLVEVKSRFLPEDIGTPESRREVYALETEFARTKKNRSWFFYLVAFGFPALIVAATLFITWRVQEKHNQVELAILEFEEIKLKDILDATRNDEKNLELARRELESLRARYREAQAQLREQTATEMAAIAGLPETERQPQIRRIQEKQAVESQKIRQEFESKIATQQKIVSDYEKKVQARQKQMAEGVAKAESILSNHERLMKLRLDKQQAEYEKKIADLILKYNPNFTEPELRRIVASEKTNFVAPRMPTEPFAQDLAREKIAASAQINKLRNTQEEQKKLIARLREIPYTNSVAPALVGIDRRNREITAEYEALLLESVRALRRKNEALASYRAALRELADREREYGYVLDARKSTRLRIYLNPSLRVRPGMRAGVFRKDDEYIGDIEIYLENDEPMAKVINLAEGKAIAAFDKIYLEDR
ncbi:MAG: hypothetical protein N2Z22_01905 [Turneriella sp.]|nr:hypothetical protein [Turneriella sp.]